MSTVSLLIINPNSSKSVTDGLEQSLSSNVPPQTTLEFYTAPSHAPPSINDPTTAVLTAAACHEDIVKRGLLDKYDGFLVCCFSDHPLIPILRSLSPKPILGIMQSAISLSLLTATRFSILSTGSGPKPLRQTEVHTFLGSSSSFRFSGLITTGLGVVELREGDREHVEKSMKESAVKAVREGGADALVLGCAGMAGMEGLVKEGVRQAGLGEIKVVDGARAGVQMLVGLVRVGEL